MGAAGGHIGQRGVGEHEVGRQVLLLGDAGAQRFQRVQQRRRRVRRRGGALVPLPRPGLHLIAAGEGDGLAAEQHVPGLGRELQRLMLRADEKIFLDDQLVHAGADLGGGVVPHQAVGGETVQFQIQHPLPPAAPEHLDDQRRAHEIAQLFPHPQDAGEDHLGGHGDVLIGESAGAVAAAAAIFRVVLAEIVQDDAAEAPPALAVGDHGVQPPQVLLMDALPGGLVQGVVFRTVLDEGPGGDDVRGGVEQDAVRRFPVAPGAAGLLVVGFQAFWHIVVDHEGDVGFVDAHAEGVGGHHDGAAVILEILLILPTLAVLQPGVIADGFDAVGVQIGADALHRRAGGAVYDAAFPAPLLQQAPQRRGAVGGLQHVEIEVRPVEAGDDAEGIAQRKGAQNVGAHRLCGGGGESGQDRPLGQPDEEIMDFQIAGAEILAPLGDAVGFVHCYQRQRQGLQQGGKARGLQPLWRGIQQLVRSGAQAAVNVLQFFVGEGTVDTGGADAVFLQGQHLILHQGDQRRNDQREPRQHQRGDLVAQRFAAAGGHHGQGVPTAEHGVDDRLLPGTEGVVAEILFKKGEFIHKLRSHPAKCVASAIIICLCQNGKGARAV